jgi:SpoVK/Ycf46/Vps4 family AAA+-type ATPase
MPTDDKDRQDRIDSAIARQLARSMKMNGRLQARIHSLRAALETVKVACRDSQQPFAITIRDLCEQTLSIDERTPTHDE